MEVTRRVYVHHIDVFPRRKLLPVSFGMLPAELLSRKLYPFSTLPHSTLKPNQHQEWDAPSALVGAVGCNASQPANTVGLTDVTAQDME